MKTTEIRLKSKMLRAFCSALALTIASSLPVMASEFEGFRCSDLWYERNNVYHAYGYCFQGQRGKKRFGNQGCHRTAEQASQAMGAANRAFVQRVKDEEQRRGC
jgi:hypothetical protein